MEEITVIINISVKIEAHVNIYQIVFTLMKRNKKKECIYTQLLILFATAKIYTNIVSTYKHNMKRMKCEVRQKERNNKNREKSEDKKVM